MEKLIALLTSRKFWASLIGLILLIVKGFWPDFPITEGQLTDVVYLLVAFIVGTGIESGLQSRR